MMGSGRLFQVEGTSMKVLKLEIHYLYRNKDSMPEAKGEGPCVGR